MQEGGDSPKRVTRLKEELIHSWCGIRRNWQRRGSGVVMCRAWAPVTNRRRSCCWCGDERSIVEISCRVKPSQRDPCIVMDAVLFPKLLDAFLQKEYIKAKPSFLISRKGG